MDEDSSTTVRNRDERNYYIIEATLLLGLPPLWETTKPSEFVGGGRGGRVGWGRLNEGGGGGGRQGLIKGPRLGRGGCKGHPGTLLGLHTTRRVRWGFWPDLTSGREIGGEIGRL